MELGLGLETWSSRTAELPLEQVRRAEALGFHSVWSAEAYGADALIPLATIAARTERIALATGLLQVSARPAVTAAMSLATLARLAPGRKIIAGLGVSGPQVVEGWYGQPWGRPLTRLREYVAVMRQALAREGPVALDGREIQLPYHGPGASGLGKPLKPILHAPPGIEIWPAGGGPRAVAQAAEIGDGWLPMGFLPELMATYRPQLEQGLARRHDGMTLERFKIWPILPVVLADDVRATLDALKPGIALLVGGYGAKEKNFHVQQMARCGFAEAADRIQALWLAGRREEAIRAVPDEYPDSTRLIGPAARIRERFAPWSRAAVTGYTIYTQSLAGLELMAELAGTRDRG
ncbi:MAG: LLM class flavin-dependent oxidoreductase [Deltaproteobacteria bacterium]|nr:LLM class flavin-dependent oxidoreductase [Deltaproteobacteria bacterium]